MQRALSRSFIGSEAKVEAGLRSFLAALKPDEVMVPGHFFDPQDRLRSYRILSGIHARLG